MAAIENTKLTRNEYQDKVNEWIKNNPKKFKELRKTTKNKPWPAVQELLEPELGKPYWTEVKGSRAKTGLVPGKGEKGFEFRIYNQGGKAGFKSKPTRRETRGNLQRRASTAEQSISLDEYIAVAKRHGFSEAEAIEGHELNQAKLKKLAGKTQTLKGTPLNYEHLTPNVSKAYGGLEHWRNIGLLGEGPNLKKSDYLITKPTARKAGIPLTKEEAILMDLRKVEPVAAGKVRRIIEADLTSRTPVRARLRNQFVSNIEAPKRISLPRKTNSGITNILDVLVAGGKRGLTKAARNVAPVAGTAMDALDTADRYNEFRQEPNLMNAAQLTTSAISTGANIVSDLALSTGFGAPVAAVAEKVGGIMNITEGGLEALETYRNLPKESKRRFKSQLLPKPDLTITTYIPKNQ